MNCTKAGPRIIKVFTLFFGLVYFVTMASNVFDNNVTAIPLYIYVLMNIAVGLTALFFAIAFSGKDELEKINTGSDLLLAIFAHLCLFISWSVNILLVYSMGGGWKSPIPIKNAMSALAIPCIATFVTYVVIYLVPLMLIDWIMGSELTTR